MPGEKGVVKSGGLRSGGPNAEISTSGVGGASSPRALFSRNLLAIQPRLGSISHQSSHQAVLKCVDRSLETVSGYQYD